MTNCILLNSTIWLYFDLENEKMFVGINIQHYLCAVHNKYMHVSVNLQRGSEAGGASSANSSHNQDINLTLHVYDWASV